MKIKTIKIIAFLAYVSIVQMACTIHEPEVDFYNYTPEDGEIWEGKDAGSSVDYAVDAPPFTDGIYPCNDCHSEIEPNPERRELVDMHDDITAIYDHDSENRWCLACHDLENRDYLRLANGELLDFKVSYRLCGQCHGDKLRDWKVGVHGKRKGMWNGKKEYLLCVHCHNPHSPKFEAITPEPPPVMHITLKNTDQTD